MARPLVVTFEASDVGGWQIDSVADVTGPGVASAARLAMVEGPHPDPEPTAVWSLRGVTSNERYVERAERTALSAIQAPLGRPDATAAALIPIRKSEAWWELPQDERRAIVEERSRHITVGLDYLPAVARRLHHSRDLGGEFDFLTWFEFPPSATDAFEDLVARLRATEEWSYVDREVDLRLTR